MPPPTSFVPVAPPTVEDDQLNSSIWRKRFEKRPLSSQPVIGTLDVEYNELAQSWKRFNENLPLEDQVKFQERPQTLQDVLAVVRIVQTLWLSHPRQQVFSRSMTLCDTFIDTINPHAVLLMTLPKSESYRSLFYGVLQSVIRASANYPRIMEGVIKALVKVNQSICLPSGSSRISSNTESIPPIATFYSLTFFFLGELMDWYVRRSKCRLLQSLHQDIYLNFRYLIWSIRSSAIHIIGGLIDGMDLDDPKYEKKRKIMQTSDLYLWEETRLSQVGMQKWDRRTIAQTAMTRQLIWEIQHDAAERLKMRTESHPLLVEMLDLTCQRLRSVTQQNSGIACLTTTVAQDIGMQGGDLGTDLPSELTLITSQETSRFKWSSGPKHKYTRVELQLASKHLQDFFRTDDQVTDLNADVDVIAEDSVMGCLQQWATNVHSQVLAIGGFPSTAFPSPVALISACSATCARKARLPVISHFCSLPTEERNGMTLFEQGLISLAYSLIRQLIDYLPPVLEGHAACNLSTERFSPLNGTMTCWKEVLSLIDILLYLAPPVVVCVIDGLDVLEDSSTDAQIRSLVRTLLTHTRHQTTPTADGTESQDVLLKVLFTVVGRPNTLVEALSENHLILSESNRIGQVASTDQALNPDVGIVMMNA
ncbi:hypothetical protein BDV28DRAFT_132676 [Aspergillus coremiiformis]|uniref:DUF7708 domain-containing protein n=1 Tax=Aspergillus coremiiformis TaxID=138285 RepID=A0A5N6Z7P3_9EURO|nr:hypothetical protein BDV28DRAFT_132676 [Aspergillus coremiiformis]